MKQKQLIEKYIIKNLHNPTINNNDIKGDYKKEMNKLENQVEMFLEKFETTLNKYNKLLDKKLLTKDNLENIHRLNQDLSKINSYLQ